MKAEITIDKISESLALYPRDLNIFIGRPLSSAIYRITDVELSVGDIQGGGQLLHSTFFYTQKCEHVSLLNPHEKHLKIDDVLTRLSLMPDGVQRIVFQSLHGVYASSNLLGMQLVELPSLGETMLLVLN